MKVLFHQNTKISGTYTVEDWFEMKKILQQSPTIENFEIAYNNFFYNRLKTRYLNPIELLDKHKIWEGEGTSILTIICSLIEFLQASYEGKKYFYSSSNEEYDNSIHYKKSDQIFKKFLRTQPPFKEEFSKDNNLPKEFYDSVRNGLLHEARLKGKWRIHAYENQNKIIDKDKHENRWIINRVNLKQAIYKYLEYYKEQVLTSNKRQQALIIKIDSFCYE